MIFYYAWDIEGRISEEDKLAQMQEQVPDADRYVVDWKREGPFAQFAYGEMVRVMREGDVLYLHDLYAIGTGFDDFVNEWRRLTWEKIEIVVLHPPDYFDSQAFRKLGHEGQLLEEQALNLLLFFQEEKEKRGEEKPIKRRKPRRPTSTDEVTVFQKWAAKELTTVEAAAMLGWTVRKFGYRTKRDGFVRKS